MSEEEQSVDKIQQAVEDGLSKLDNLCKLASDIEAELNRISKLQYQLDVSEVADLLTRGTHLLTETVRTTNQVVVTNNQLNEMIIHDLVGVIHNLEKQKEAAVVQLVTLQTFENLLKKKGLITQEELEQEWGPALNKLNSSNS